MRRRYRPHRARVTERVQPGVVGTPPSISFRVRRQCDHDRKLGLQATNCPEYKVTAVQATRVSQPSEWQKRFREFTDTQESLLKSADVFVAK